MGIYIVGCRALGIMIEKLIGGFEIRLWCKTQVLRYFSDLNFLEFDCKVKKTSELSDEKVKVPQVGERVLLRIISDFGVLNIKSTVSAFENHFILLDASPLNYFGYIYSESGAFIGFVLPVSIGSQLTAGMAITYVFNIETSVKCSFDVPVFKVYSEMQGSGVVVSDDYIVTNAHVVRNSTTCSILSGKNTGKLVKKGKILDLAILKLSNKQTSAKLATAYFEGQQIFTVGFGIIEGQIPLITSGYLTKIVYYQGQAILGMINAKTFNGQSGGGVFNENKELIGIITANGQDVTEGIYENLGFCILITAFQEFLLSKNFMALKIFDDESLDLKALCEFQTTKYLPSPKL